MLVAKTKFTSYLKRLQLRKDKAKKSALDQVAKEHQRALRNIFKVRPGPSRPGSAPHSHPPIRGLRRVSRAVGATEALVGSIRFPHSRKLSKPVPGVHEKGKQVYILGFNPILVRYPRRPAAATVVKSRKNKTPKQFAAVLARGL